MLTKAIAMSPRNFSEFRPNEPLQELLLIDDLKAWLKENRCNFLSYGIGTEPSEGHFLANDGDTGFAWYFTERGVKRLEKCFETEAEAVSFAFKQIKGDSLAWRHMIGFLKQKWKLAFLIRALKKREIFYYQDTIPYGGPRDLRYRVFVNGLDMTAVADLKIKYGK